MKTEDKWMLAAVVVLVIATVFAAVIFLKEDSQWRKDCRDSGGFPYSPKGAKRLCIDPKFIRP